MRFGTGTRIVIGAAIFFLIFGISIMVSAHISSVACERKAVALGIAYTWDLGIGCFIETEPGKWVRAENL